MKRLVMAAAVALVMVSMSCRLPHEGGDVASGGAADSGASDHDSVFSRRGLLTAKADELRSTYVTAHLRHPIKAGQNVLWCATMQLCWNAFEGPAGGELVTKGEDDTVDGLKKNDVDETVIDPESCLVIAGMGPGTVKDIRSELRKKFGRRARPRLISKPSTVGPLDAIGYCYMFKHMEFAVPFGRIRWPMAFTAMGSAKRLKAASDWQMRQEIERSLPLVECFGIDSNSIARPGMREQVLVYGYPLPPEHERYEGRRIGPPDSFVVELKTKSRGDRLILARLRPRATLGGTVKAVVAKMAATEAEPMGPSDVLKVPKVNFDITRDYREIKDAVIGVRKGGAVSRFVVQEATQNIRFQLDEKGVRLRSEAYMRGGCSSMATPQFRQLVFDGPYLIMLMRKDRALPYFALWVDNTELLLKRRR